MKTTKGSGKTDFHTLKDTVISELREVLNEIDAKEVNSFIDLLLSGYCQKFNERI